MENKTIHETVDGVKSDFSSFIDLMKVEKRPSKNLYSFVTNASRKFIEMNTPKLAPKTIKNALKSDMTVDFTGFLMLLNMRCIVGNEHEELFNTKIAMYINHWWSKPKTLSMFDNELLKKMSEKIIDSEKK